MKFADLPHTIQSLQNGEMIVLVNESAKDDSQRTKGIFMCLAERATPQLINLMTLHGKGLVSIPMTKKKAESIKLPVMSNTENSNSGTLFSVSIDGVETTTGISAFERSMTVQSLLKENITEHDFRRPGHLFPLICRDKGLFERVHFVEASVDLAVLCRAHPMAVICQILNEDGGIASLSYLEQVVEAMGLAVTSIQNVLKYRFSQEQMLQRLSSRTLMVNGHPLKLYEYANSHSQETYRVILHEETVPEKAAVSTVQECFYRDVLQVEDSCSCPRHLSDVLPDVYRKEQIIVITVKPSTTYRDLMMDEESLRTLIVKDLSGGNPSEQA